MEVLFITHKYPPSVGGMENQSFHLITGVEKYTKVHKIVFDGQGSVFKFYLGLRKQVQKVLDENPNIDLIHCNDGTIGVMCSWLKKYTKAKTSVTLHGLDVVFPSKLFQNRLLKRLKQYDLVITVSSATKEECLKRGFDEHRVVCVPNGVDHDIAEIPTNPKAISNLLSEKGIDASQHRFVVSMGRAVKRKGFSWFIENVLPKLPKDVIYLIVGPFKTKASFGDKVLSILPKGLAKNIALLFGIPTDQKRIRELLRKEEFKNRVLTLGKLPFKDLVSCVSLSNVFVMPNIKVEGDLEGFGLVALEACMRGTTVLASNIEGIQDAIIDGKNGIRVQSGEAQDWVQKILANIEVNSNIQERNKSFVKYTIDHYSWDKMANAYLEEFQKIV